MSSNAGTKEKIAAGGIVIDASDEEGVRVLLVHRPRYDDWSFPKGGVEPGETVEQAAMREVKEEAGLECRIIRALTTAHYNYRTRKGEERPKVVHYFLMERVSGSPSSNGDEVDAVRWFNAAEAGRKLSYERDKDLLKLALSLTPAAM